MVAKCDCVFCVSIAAACLVILKLTVINTYSATAAMMKGSVIQDLTRGAHREGNSFAVNSFRALSLTSELEMGREAQCLARLEQLAGIEHSELEQTQKNH